MIRPRSGFTLLEIIVAFCLGFALAMVTFGLDELEHHSKHQAGVSGSVQEVHP